MRVLIKKKLWLGNTVELRDYEVDNLIKYNQTVKVVIDNPALPEHEEYMLLRPAQLKKGRVNNTQHSKFNEGQMYLLVGFKWKGTKPLKEESVEISIDTRKKLAEMWRNVLKK